MEIEMIVREIRDMIHDVKGYSNDTSSDRRDAQRVFNRVEEGREYTEYGYETVAEGLVDATHALERAYEKFGYVEGMLEMLIDKIEREALSAKVQAK